MNKQKESQAPEELRKSLPSPEEAAELLGKATKVTSWLSALKQQTRRRPFLGKSEDGKFCVMLRDYRIESLNADETSPDIAKSLVPRRPTGRRAAVDGVRVAGKTSTMQRMKPDSYKYDFEKSIASFAGFFPVDDPQYVLVVCYETKRIEGVPYIHQGGGRPAMAFSEMVRAMSYVHNNVSTKE